MNNEQLYYLHQRMYPHSQRHAPLLYHFSQNGHRCKGLAINNYNHIQIYQIVGSSISYVRKYDFVCNISIMEVIPLKNQSSDMIFIADELGRFGFFTEEKGIILANNLIRSKKSPITFYKDLQNKQSNAQFHGINFTFNVHDTEGIIFFTVENTAICINFSVKKGKLKLKALKQFVIPYNQVIYVGMMDSNIPQIGIIEQRQERRFLQFHSLETFELIWTIEKSSITEFNSFCRGQFITVTNFDLCIYKQKNYELITTFKISQPGHIKKLQDDKYIYIGESASEMIVFNKKKYKNYGSFMLENDFCAQVGTYGMLEDGGYLLGIVDQGFTVEFIVVYESTWKALKSISGMSSIFTLQQLNKAGECLTVTKVSDNIHSVGVITNRQPCLLKKQTKYQSPITNVFSVQRGRYLIISRIDDNILMSYNPMTQEFDFQGKLMAGRIILATDSHIITQSKIFTIDYERARHQLIVQDTAQIVHACFDGSYIGYFCKNCSYKFLNTKTNRVDRIRKECSTEYYWHFHAPQILLVANYQEPGFLTHMPIFQGVQKIALTNKEMVASMESKGQLVLISYVNAKIDVYSFNEKAVIHSLQAISQPLKLISCESNMVAIGSSQAFYIQFDETLPTLKPIQFDSMKEISLFSYLLQQKKMLIITNEAFKLYQLPVSCQRNPHFRIISVHLTERQQNVPFAICPPSSRKIYIASNYEIIIKDLYNGEVHKKQTHMLKEINCIQYIDIGILVGGIDDMEIGQIILFGLQDLQVLSSITLGEQIPGNVKKVSSNTFAIRHNNYFMMEQITNENTVIKEKFKSKTNLNGYTLTINPQNQMVAMSDPLKYLVTFDYRTNSLIPLARFSCNNMINYCEFLGNSLICGDCGGYIQALQFNFEDDDIHKTLITSVGGLNMGTEIMMMNLNQQNLIYATMSGYIGRIERIAESEFRILKEAERVIFKRIEQSEQFKYSVWRQRENVEDKFIDSFLIHKYLETNQESELYEKVKVAAKTMIQYK